MFEWTKKNSFFHPQLIVVTLLGFSSGLPRLLVASTLGAMLLERGIDKATIGAFAYVALPYAFHWAWAPFLDHVKLPFFTKRFGRRVGWMLFSQILLAAALAWMGLRLGIASPLEIAVIAVGIAFFSASQDVIIDAYRTEYLHKDLYGKGAASAVFGYRLGMLAAGAGALALADQVSWGAVYVTMAVLMAVGMVTVLIAGEPEMTAPKIEAHNGMEWFKRAVIEPFLQFLSAHPQAWLILLFIAVYRMPDGFISFMTTPFFLDIGFTKTQIAAVGKLYGFIAVIAGGFAGGALLDKFGLRNALFFFMLMHLCTLSTYLLLNAQGAEIPFLILTVSLDNFTGGMVTAAAVALLMRLCDQRYTATQYALLGSLATLASTTLSGSAGWMAQAYGWEAMFSISIALGAPAILLLGILWRNPSISLTSSR